MSNANSRARTAPAAVSSTLRGVAELLEAGLLPDRNRPALEAAAAGHAVGLTPEMAALIDPGDPNDPIGRQFLPTAAELDRRPEEEDDPIGDNPRSPLKGLVHRYPDRVLLKPLHTCPVYCRFCFRRESVGPAGAGTLSEAELAAAFAYIAARPQVFELIVSGGDPFMLSARRMAAIAGAAGAIAHIGVMRWHTRVPLVDPGRVNARLIAAIRRFPGAVYVAVHANHPREFTPEGCGALARLAEAGIVLLSQSVLLKGINDDADVLEDLMRAFIANRVNPYYLHHLDRAPGTAHFRVPPARGQALMRTVSARLGDLAQPTYVLDLPGGHGKVPLGPSPAAHPSTGSG
ncbi:MAG: lysine-2,3-aminomutase-like protein [Rhodospirillales bacterium]|nr:lysine-2,3-aminomutase-like protein [Rhodospirillales bacterium]